MMIQMQKKEKIKKESKKLIHKVVKIAKKKVMKNPNSQTLMIVLLKKKKGTNKRKRMVLKMEIDFQLQIRKQDSSSKKKI